MNFCEYTIEGCECAHGEQEPGCTAVKCGAPATVKIWGGWYCEKHADRIEEIVSGKGRAEGRAKTMTTLTTHCIVCAKEFELTTEDELFIMMFKAGIPIAVFCSAECKLSYYSNLLSESEDQ